MIRPAKVGDLPEILQLIKDLAIYERAEHEVLATVEELERTLFGDVPKVFAHVVEIEGKVVGIAIWFLNYSTWLGKHGIYLEDLYVQPEFRGQGFGLALLKELARICVERGYPRFQWWVLDWNSPAIEFYSSHGAVAMDEWTVHRITGDALKKLGS